MSLVPFSVRTRGLGVSLVLAGIVFQVLWLGLPAILVSAGLLISYALWVGSPWRYRPRLKGAFRVAVLVFLGHVVEEFLTGLHHAVPALFGRAPWSEERFLLFNGMWLLVFVVAAFTAAPTRALPVLIILFVAVAAGVANGLAHLLLVLQSGGYFPGAWTAPLCLLMGVWLLRLLYAPEVADTRPSS